jgi:hypothetical protein
LTPGLNFSHGIAFEANVKKFFGHSVNCLGFHGRRDFLLVILFGCAKFKLDIHMVGLVLQACYGVSAAKFKVKHLRDRSFRFSVSSKSVGFDIYNKGKISEEKFELFINLWGNGGPNWMVEELKFYKEQDASWSIVQRYVKKRSVIDRLKFPPNLNTSTHVVPISYVFDRLKFPNIVENGSTFIQPGSNVSLGQSYAQAVSNRVVTSLVNSPLNSGQYFYQPINNQRKSGDFALKKVSAFSWDFCLSLNSNRLMDRICRPDQLILSIPSSKPMGLVCRR